LVFDLHRELNRLKKGKLSWMYEVSKCAPQEALRDLEAAFSNFFGHRAGFPNFKSRCLRVLGEISRQLRYKTRDALMSHGFGNGVQDLPTSCPK